MAVIKISEPYVKVDERIRAYPTLLNIDGTANIGGVIVAPTGPRLAYVSGPQDFLNKYTVDGNIPRNADITFLNAYYLSFSTGLVIARSMNTTAVNGVFFKEDSVNVNYVYLNAQDPSFWGLSIEGKYYFCNGSDKDFKSFIAKAEKIMDIDPDQGTESMVYQDEIDSIEDLSNSDVIYCKDFTDLAFKLSEYLSDSGKDLVSYNANIGGLSVKGGITLELNDSIELAYMQESGSSVTTLKGTNLNFKDNVALTETAYIRLSSTQGVFKGSNWAFTLGTMAYYCGAINKGNYSDYSLISCTSIDDIVTSISGMAGMTAELVKGNDNAAEVVIKISCSKGNELEFVEDSDLNVGLSIDWADSSVDESYTGGYKHMSDYDGWLFAVYPDNAQDSNKYSVKFEVDEGSLFYMTLSDGQTSESYTVSLNADDVDQSGANAFIENLNALGLKYTFVTNADALVESDGTPKIIKLGVDGIYTFGDSGLDLSSCKANSCMVDALYVLQDQELYDIEYLSSFGYTNLNFIKNYTLVGRANDWFTPVDIPYDRTNQNSIKGYFLNVDNSSNVLAVGPFDKNTGLTGWMFPIAGSTLYYTKVFNNRAAGKEFAPVFDITNGVLDYTQPYYLLGKEDRTALLNFKCPVNFAVFNQRSNVYYFNDNRTHQSEVNIVSEEQNRRMVNKIKKDCKRLMQSFKGRLNTAKTRLDVESVLRYYFQTNIMVGEYKPNEFEVICDESNNPVQVINANKLGVTVRVRLENAIKFIDVLVDVFPLGVDFNE